MVYQPEIERNHFYLYEEIFFSLKKTVILANFFHDWGTFPFESTNSLKLLN